MPDKPVTAVRERLLKGAGGADFRAVFDAAPRPLLLMAADPPRFTMLAVNPAHARAFGTTPSALEGWGVLEVFPADLTGEAAGFAAAIRRSLEAVLATRAPDQMGVRPIPAPAGGAGERYVTATNCPILNAAGEVTHIVSAVQDVTGEVLEKRNEEIRSLLMSEVDHRARNALTVVQSLVQLTQAPDLETFKSVVLGRVEALARAQTSLARRKWEGGNLRDVVDQELAAMTDARRYELTGPDVLLPPEQVQAMSMAVHELATNAAKYGALARRGGRLSVSWSRKGDRLRLVWRETGAKDVKAPEREGFGSRLLERLTRQLGGAISRRWEPDGLCVELTAAL
ncbi:MAG: sensor histidine kinase [Phenylobacterium sp.]